MTSENYRQLLNAEFKSKEMTPEDFDNTLMHFAKLYHEEKLSINGVYKRLLEVKFRYLNITDARIHSDTFEAETHNEALQMFYDKYGYNVEWRSICDA